MIMLLTKALPTVERLGGCGVLLTPRFCTNPRRVAASGLTWAADNDAYNGGGIDTAAYLAMLAKLATTNGENCAFVTTPDVVGDARATMHGFAMWRPILLACNLPVGYVLQDGIEGVGAPWNQLDAVFVGGTTQFKMSQHVAGTVHEAKRRGKWVHMGRVNSAQRIEYAAAIGCDSFDGSSYSKFTDTHAPRAIAQAAQPAQGVLRREG